MLQACLNGGRPGDLAGVPITPEALARDAVAAKAAGAAEFHIHPRDETGAETLKPAHVADALTAIRAAVPGMPVGIGTGDWIAPGGVARHADMAAWDVLPDYVSINLNEPDAFDVMAMMAERGIGIEAGVADVAEARRLALHGGEIALTRIMIEMEDIPPPEARAEAVRCQAILHDTPFRAPVLLHGFGQSAWPILMDAARQGLQMRIGFEDVTHLPDGRPATSNAQIIAMAQELIEQVEQG